MTRANYVTITRFLIAVLFAWVWYVGQKENSLIFLQLAVGIFILGVFSDVLDGFLARYYNERSLLGTVLDPLADKIFVLSGVFMVAFFSKGLDFALPLWFLFLFLARDFFVTMGIFWVYFATKRIEMHICKTGRAASVMQMVLLLLILMQIFFPAEPESIFLFKREEILLSFAVLITGVNLVAMFIYWRIAYLILNKRFFINGRAPNPFYPVE